MTQRQPRLPNTPTPNTIPEIEEAADDARFLLSLARNYIIATTADLQLASDERGRIKARYNEIEDLRKRLKAPVLAAAANIDAQFKAPLLQLQQAVTVIDDGIKAFQRRVEEERRKEQLRLLALAQAEEERLRELALAAEDEGDLEMAERLSEQASDAVDLVPSVPTGPVKVAGIQMREKWTFELIDGGKLLPREYLMPDLTRIRRVVEAMKGECRISGVRVWRDDIVAGGRG